MLEAQALIIKLCGQWSRQKVTRSLQVVEVAAVEEDRGAPALADKSWIIDLYSWAEARTSPWKSSDENHCLLSTGWSKEAIQKIVLLGWLPPVFSTSVAFAPDTDRSKHKFLPLSWTQMVQPLAPFWHVSQWFPPKSWTWDFQPLGSWEYPGLITPRWFGGFGRRNSSKKWGIPIQTWAHNMMPNICVGLVHIFSILPRNFLVSEKKFAPLRNMAYYRCILLYLVCIHLFKLHHFSWRFLWSQNDKRRFFHWYW